MSFHSNVDIYPKDSAIMAKVNGVEIQNTNMPYHHPTGFDFIHLNITVILRLFNLLLRVTYLLVIPFISGKIQIRQRGHGIALFAPSHGLQEVYFDLNAWKVIQEI